nr:alternative protein FGFR2 [Homo sapiens]
MPSHPEMMRMTPMVRKILSVRTVTTREHHTGPTQKRWKSGSMLCLRPTLSSFAAQPGGTQCQPCGG